MNRVDAAVAACLMLACATAPAPAAAASNEVVLLLRTYTSATSADEECVPGGPVDADVTTLRLSCPSSVQVDALADGDAGWQVTHQQLAAGPYVLNRYRLVNVGTTPPEGRSAPLQITLRW